MKKALLSLAVCLVAWNTTRADSVTVGFPSGGSTVVSGIPGGFVDGDSVGYFWSVARGDSVSQTYTGLSLASVGQLDLDLSVDANNLGSGNSVDWDVFLNGIQVGSWSRSSAEGTGMVNLSFSFAPIVGAGTYTIAMFVTNEVPSGDGSISLGYPTRATLYSPTVVPEPTSAVLAGLGVLGALVGRRRIRQG